MPDIINITEMLLVAILGLVFGSFCSALIYRIPRDIPWIWDKNSGYNGKNKRSPSRSACPECHAPLRIIDLIPFFSWAFLLGKCRYCKKTIPSMYPAAELLTLLGFLTVYILLGFDWIYSPVYLLVPVLVALLFIDIRHYILPNELVAITGILGAVYLVIVLFTTNPTLEPFLLNHIGGAFLYGGIAWGLGWSMSAILKKEALGFGDVKFFFVAGIWLGIAKFSLFALGAGIIGILFAIGWRLAGKGEVFPFGPALILSFFTVLFL